MSETDTEPKGRIVRPARIPRTCNCGGREFRRYHKHADGSHWCNYCFGYCGGSSIYGSDMADADHPIHCSCPPCPDITRCYGIGFYNADTADKNKGFKA